VFEIAQSAPVPPSKGLVREKAVTIPNSPITAPFRSGSDLADQFHGMPAQGVGSLPVPVRKPKGSRRWLQSLVPKERLYRLAPSRPKPRRLGAVDFWDRGRNFIRAWWRWLAAAILLQQAGIAYGALSAATVSFILYHTSPNSHPTVYALQPEFDTGSAEFRTTMAGMTGIPWWMATKSKFTITATNSIRPCGKRSNPRSIP